MTQSLLPLARNLRRHQTDAEKCIWSSLRGKQLGHKFKRQQPIGSYIVDFICFEQRLIIEIDGGQHTNEKDADRTAYLERQGYYILRFWNNEVIENREGVIEIIVSMLSTPLPVPLPQGERVL